MNTAKIAALYASPSLNPCFRYAWPEGSIIWGLHKHAAEAHRQAPDAQGYTWRMDAGCMRPPEPYRNVWGELTLGFIDIHCPQRVAAWVLAQLPQPTAEVWHLSQGLPIHEQHLITVWGHSQVTGQPTQAYMRCGALTDFTLVLRGMAAYVRKCDKQHRRLLAQLRAYHRQLAGAVVDIIYS